MCSSSTRARTAARCAGWWWWLWLWLWQLISVLLLLLLAIPCLFAGDCAALTRSFLICFSFHWSPQDFSGVREGEVVILPAFGASVQEMRLLSDRKVQIVDTTCPWVR